MCISSRWRKICWKSVLKGWDKVKRTRMANMGTIHHRRIELWSATWNGFQDPLQRRSFFTSWIWIVLHGSRWGRRESPLVVNWRSSIVHWPGHSPIIWRYLDGAVQNIVLQILGKMWIVVKSYRNWELFRLSFSRSIISIISMVNIFMYIFYNSSILLLL